MSVFEKKATETLECLKNSLTSVIQHFGEPNALRPIDLCNFMNLDMNLAWKVNRLVNSSDLFSMGKYLPGDKALRTFSEKAAEAGVPDETAMKVRQVSTDLDLLIRTGAGSRKQFTLMLAGLSTEERSANDVIHRRKSFEGNSYTFGVQSEIQLSVCILMVSKDDPNLVDLCRIRGHAGLSRTRTGIPCRVASTYILDSNGNVKTTPSREYLDSVEPGKPPFLQKFSSSPMPDFGSVTDSSGKTTFFIIGREIGTRSSTNFFTADVMRKSGALYRSAPGEGAALNNSISIPTKRLVADVYFPEEFNGTAYEAEMWSLLYPSRDYSGMTSGDSLPVTEQPALYRQGKAPGSLAGIPCYKAMMESCFGKLELDMRDYSLLRLSMEYPPIPASVDFLIELPEKRHVT